MREAAVASSASPSRFFTAFLVDLLLGDGVGMLFEDVRIRPERAHGVPFPCRSVLLLTTLVQFALGEVEAVVAPEAALADEDGGHAEDAAGQREIGVLAQGVLHFLRVGARRQRLA